jgi:DnaJ-class molecular chaperone
MGNNDIGKGASAPKQSPGAGTGGNPGDEARPGTPGTGEDICPQCQGRGEIARSRCPNCGGTGRIVEGIGGA